MKTRNSHRRIDSRQKSDELFKKGFTLIELITVVAIISIMSAILLSISSNSTGKTKVRVNAEQYLAAMREAQNGALSGGKVGAFRACKYYFLSTTSGFSVQADVYDQTVSGGSCDSPTTANITSVVFSDGAQLAEGFPTQIGFDVPFGTVQDAFAVGVTEPALPIVVQDRDAEFNYLICLYRSGRIEARGFTSPLNCS